LHLAQFLLKYFAHAIYVPSIRAWRSPHGL